MKTPRQSVARAAVWLLLLSPVAVPAQPAPAAAAAATEMTAGEVRKVDLDAGKVTLRHAEIKSLDMPGMTMVFAVRDKAALAKLKAGDKVSFKAVSDNGRFTVTEIRPVP